MEVEMEHVTLTYETILQAVCAGIVEIREGNVGLSDVSEATRLWDSGGSHNEPCLALDSLDIVDLMFLLEEELGVVANADVQFEDVQMVRDIVRLFQSEP
jgi:hypothetical protein